MAITTTHKEIQFGVGDTVRVSQNITDGTKTRIQVYEGMVIGIKGRREGKSFTVRRIGAAQVGIEKIFPVSSPTVESVEVVKEGGKGVKSAKLYYTRKKSRKEISKIYTRANRKNKNPKRVSRKDQVSVKDPKTAVRPKGRKSGKKNTSK